jgi:polysaccharide export outer membrane protein
MSRFLSFILHPLPPILRPSSLTPHASSLLLICVLAAPGCAGGRYRVASLPKEYSAPPVVNVEALDLAGLAGPSESFDVIQRGDVLEVTMVTDFTKLTTTTTPVRVGDDGIVSVPLIGPVRIGGITAEEAERLIAGEGIARGIFRTPCVTVTMKEQRKNKVVVVGAVKKPGVHELPRGSSSLLAALVAAEGLTKEAGVEVEIRRGGVTGPGPRPTVLPPLASDPAAEGQAASYQEPQPAASVFPATFRVNLADAAQSGRAPHTLEDGDVVHVVKRTLKPVYVQGLVRKPGEFEYPVNQELRLLDALALAGGISNPIADQVLVIRQLPGQANPINVSVSVQEAKGGRDNLRLAPGDTVIVEQNAATALVDAVQTFFRIGFSASFPMF